MPAVPVLPATGWLLWGLPGAPRPLVITPSSTPVTALATLGLMACSPVVSALKTVSPVRETISEIAMGSWRVPPLANVAYAEAISTVEKLPVPSVMVRTSSIWEVSRPSFLHMAMMFWLPMVSATWR